MTLLDVKIVHPMMRQRGVLAALAGLIAAGCQVGCAPAIHSFTITPQVLCAGETAVIQWDASGSTTLQVSPEPAPAGAPGCAVRGRTGARYTLTAQRGGKDKGAELEVLDLQDSGAELVEFNTAAIEANRVVASGDKSDLWRSPRVTIATVAACGDRVIEVQHAARVATLPADGAPSAALDGTTVAGRWELRSPLSPDEQNNPLARPKDLAILATFRCQQGAQ